jgi:hypothetical protein
MTYLTHKERILNLKLSSEHQKIIFQKLTSIYGLVDKETFNHY